MNSKSKNVAKDSLSARLAHEAKTIALVALYFGCWLAALFLIKLFLLTDYGIAFSGLSKALIGALILSKVVLILEHVSLGAWVKSMPAWIDVMLRTVLYSLGVLVVLILEKGFDGRHEYGGFVTSLGAVFQHIDIYHTLVNAIAISGALLVYNVLAVIRRHLGEGGLLKLFLHRPTNGRR